MTEPSPPFFSQSVAAGFPSPASDERGEALNLQELCVPHPASTYFVRARGESMVQAGISDGDILVVDRSLRAVDGDIIIASVEGDFTVKRLSLRPGAVRLLPANPAYPPLDITPEMGAEFFGVVTWVVKKLHR